MPQALQRRARVPLEEFILIGHQMKNIGDNLETCEDNGKHHSKKQTKKDKRNTVEACKWSIPKRCCLIRAEDS